MLQHRLTHTLLVTALVPCLIGLANAASAQTTTPTGQQTTS